MLLAENVFQNSITAMCLFFKKRCRVFQRKITYQVESQLIINLQFVTFNARELSVVQRRRSWKIACDSRRWRQTSAVDSAQLLLWSYEPWSSQRVKTINHGRPLVSVTLWCDLPSTLRLQTQRHQILRFNPRHWRFGVADAWRHERAVTSHSANWFHTLLRRRAVVWRHQSETWRRHSLVT